MTPFVSPRADGRSDRTVLYELFAAGKPGDVFTHGELMSALQPGSPTPITRRREMAAARAAARTLLLHEKRALVSVRGIGYKMAAAESHLELAQNQHQLAVARQKAGISILKNVRTEELSEPQRALRQGTLLIMSAHYDMIRETARRQAKSDSAIADIFRRLGVVERQLPATT